MSIPKRVPRPMGTTHLAYNYHKIEEQQTQRKRKAKNLLRELLIKNFINESLYWPYPVLVTKIENRKGEDQDKDTYSYEMKAKKNQPAQNKKPNQKIITSNHIQTHQTTKKRLCSLIRFSDLARFFSISEIRLEELVQETLSEMGRKMGENSGGNSMEYLTRVHGFRVLKKSLNSVEGLSDWAQEVMTVTRTRGYPASMILATNQALGLEQSGLKSNHDMLTKVQQAQAKNNTIIGTQNIQNNGLKPGDKGYIPDTHNGQFFTASMAMRMIEEKNLNPIPTTENGILDEIKVLNGFNASSLPAVEAIPATDMQGTMAYNPKDLIALSHEDRRQEELNIVEGMAGLDEDEEYDLVM